MTRTSRLASALLVLLVLAACDKTSLNPSDPSGGAPNGDANLNPQQNMADQPVPAATPILDPTQLFGGKDARGAYQEAHIGEISVSADYFPSDVQENLKSALIGFDLGASATLYFQDKVLKMKDSSSPKYPQLDPKRLYVSLQAIVGFDNKQDAKQGLYKLDGVITLLTGQSYLHEEYDNGQISSDFECDQTFMNPNLSSPQQAFNDLGNGKSDGGRIRVIGLHSFTPGPLTVAQLHEAMGDLVQVRYPN